MAKPFYRRNGQYPVEPEPYPETGAILHYGIYRVPLLAVHALCADGKKRSVRLSGEPDTFFSIPGTVQMSVAGRGCAVTVTGFVHWRIAPEGVTANADGRCLAFTPTGWGKNASLLSWAKPHEVVVPPFVACVGVNIETGTERRPVEAL